MDKAYTTADAVASLKDCPSYRYRHGVMLPNQYDFERALDPDGCNL